MGQREQSLQRRAGERAAATGMYGSGVHGAQSRQVSQDVNESYRQGLMDIYGMQHQEREAELGRQHQSTMQQAGFEQETAMANLTHQFQQKYLNMGYTQEQAMQAAQIEAQKYMQQAGFRQETEMSKLGYEQQLGAMGAEFGYSQQLQAQAEQAQQDLNYQKYQYQSSLQAQGFDEGMARLYAEQAFAGEQNELNRQFEYATQLSQQQYGYGMQNLQGQWDIYGQQLGYQHDYGMGQFGADLAWQNLMAEQQFVAGMQGWDYDHQYQQYQWQKYLNERNYATQKQIANASDDIAAAVIGVLGQGVGGLAEGWAGRGGLVNEGKVGSE